MSEFQSTHKLDFLACPWCLDPSMTEFKVGTCQGMYFSTDKDYVILAIINEQEGNGHFNDVLEWFEHACIRDKKSLRVTEFTNLRFRDHLINKRGFIRIGADAVKRFKKSNK